MSKLRILLVDDEERILRSLGLLLRMQYEVVTTTSGSEALKLLHQQTFHVLMSDQRMPEMTGTELLRQARSIAPRTVRILLTGYADVEASLASINEGEVFRYINKPWGPKELRDTVALAADMAHQTMLARPEPVPSSPPTPIKNQTQTSILLVDNDPETLQTVREAAGSDYRVLQCTTLEQAMLILSSEAVAILICELEIPGQDTATLIKTMKRESPSLITMVLTYLKDTRRVVELINQAQVFRYLPKPARAGVLRKSLESSLLRHHELTRSKPAIAADRLVEPIPEIREQLLSSRLSSQLHKLRSRLLGQNNPNRKGEALTQP